MSSSDSAVTYTSISSEDVPFWGIRFLDMKQPDSPEAAPQSPIQTPPLPRYEDEREPMFIQPHDPDYVPEPMYPEHITLEDEYVLPAEEQPLPPIVSPTPESPGYVVESDPEEDPEEYEDGELEDSPVDYPMDGGDDGDDDDDNLSRDDVDDEDKDEEDEKEEHLASADSTVVVPIVKPVSPHEGTEPVIPPPSTDITTTRARITVKLQASISFPPEAEVERLLAMLTPPPSLLTSLSPPSAGERLARCTTPSAHSSPPLALIDAVTAALPSHPLPPPLYIPPPIDRRDDIPETELPPSKKSCLFALCPRYEVGESSTARPTGGRGIDYGFVSTLDAEASDEGLERLGMAYASREAWAHSIGLSQAVHYELQTHRKQVYAHESQIQAQQTHLQLHDMRREMGDMQAELLALREQQRRARQPGPDARVPDHQDASRDADSHI
nr:hypothetical protein [Tanacetum cinerariifolium]